MEKKRKRRSGAEAAVQAAWRGVPSGTEFVATSGETVRVLSTGIWNRSSGPDFLHARIERGGRIVEGSVEIHVRASDWERHGHADDPKYGNVMLHVVRENDSSPGNVPFLPDVPIIVLPEVPSSSDSFDRDGKKSVPRAACAPHFAAMSDLELRAFVQDAGLDRLALKTHAFSECAIASGSRNAFLRAMMDWLGAPDNRSQFRELFLRLLEYSDEALDAHFEAVLWGESGLLPDPSSEKELAPETREPAAALWNEWWPLRMESKKKIVFSRACRPLNSPERRLAMICRWARAFSLTPFPRLIRLIETGPLEEADARLSFELEDESDLWTKRTTFHSPALKTPRALFGAARVNGLLVDVIAPALLSHAELNRSPDLAGRIRDLYCALPPAQDNSIVRLIDEACFDGRLKRSRNAAEQQGMLHLYKSHCAPHCFDCSVCGLHRSFSG